ncbi:uncharacterized protein Nmag_0260 [Natrialba magadii ATCC 43099]|nr:hypothetical protein [Natrialba magadii]ADD03852.2 uncharacterized protein Nmag_0260 [Natrialba magadii ATCC 43099]
MSKPDSEAWVETMTARERVRAVVELLEEPTSADVIAGRANVSPDVAVRELERLDVAESAGDGKWVLDRDQLRDEEVRHLIETHDYEDLKDDLQEMQNERESLREEINDVDDDREETNMRSSLAALESDIQLYQEVLRQLR